MGICGAAVAFAVIAILSQGFPKVIKFTRGLISRTIHLPPEKYRILHYYPEVVSVSGVIRRETFPGRPGYEDINKGDEPETYWILHLDRPVRVNAWSDVYEEGEFDTTEDRVDRMQLVFVKQKNEYELYRKLLGKHVVVTGTLFGSHTGHHHTRVLITVNSIKKEGKYP